MTLKRRLFIYLRGANLEKPHISPNLVGYLPVYKRQYVGIVVHGKQVYLG